MKVILVDAIGTFVLKDSGIFEGMHTLLEKFPNKKIIVTGANDEQIKQSGLNDMPYEVFTLKHDPEKTEPRYYKTLLKHFGLKAKDVVCFEHSMDAVKSAKSIGIKTHYYDKDKKDLDALKQFLNSNL